MNSFVFAALLASPMAFIKADDSADIARGIGLECSPSEESEWSTMRIRNAGDTDDKTLEGCYAYAKASAQKQFDSGCIRLVLHGQRNCDVLRRTWNRRMLKHLHYRSRF